MQAEIVALQIRCPRSASTVAGGLHSGIWWKRAGITSSCTWAFLRAEHWRYRRPSQAAALLGGRDYVTPDDVKKLFIPVVPIGW